MRSPRHRGAEGEEGERERWGGSLGRGGASGVFDVTAGDCENES